MSVILDSIDITGLVRADSFPSMTEAITEVSSGGSIIVFERNILFSIINLTGEKDSGWLTLTVLKELQALAQNMGSIYTLDYEGELFTVRFRNEEPPAVHGDKIINRSNQDGSDYYNNIFIKLMEV